MLRRGWEHCRHSQWLVRGHPGTTPAFSPMASRTQGQRQGRREASCSSSSTTEGSQKAQQQSKVGRLEAALHALVQEQSSARASLEEALKTANAEVPKLVHPQQRLAEASARVERLEAALKVLGEDDPDAELLKVWAKVQAQVRDLCLQCVTRVKKQVARAEEQVQEAKDVQAQMEETIGQWVARFGSPASRRRITHASAQNPGPRGKPWMSTPRRS